MVATALGVPARPQPRDPVPDTLPDEGGGREPAPAPREPGPAPSEEPGDEPRPAVDPDPEDEERFRKR